MLYKNKLLIAALMAVAMSSIGAAVLIPAGVSGPGLATVGPVSATEGFPVWYQDKTGLRLEKCIALADPRCFARGPLPDETAPLSFPHNSPTEGFYSLTSASLPTASGGTALAAIGLEQAFRSGPVSDGDHVTFARVRLKITNPTDGVNDKITTPAGAGTSSFLASQTVTVHLGGLNGPTLGTAVVDINGGFSLRTPSALVGRAGQTVSAESQLGGTVAGVAVQIQ